MSIEKALADLTAALNANTAALQASASDTPAPAKPRGRKAAAQAAPAPAAPAPAAPAPAPAPAAAAPAGGIVLKTVVDAITSLVQAQKRQAAVEILAAHGVAKVTDLKPEQFEGVLAAVNAAKNEQAPAPAAAADSLI